MSRLSCGHGEQFISQALITECCRYHMRGNDHHQNGLDQLRQTVVGQSASRCRGKQHAVENNAPATTESRISSYLHLDQAMFDIMEICCEVVMEVSSMIDL